MSVPVRGWLVLLSGLVLCPGGVHAQDRPLQSLDWMGGCWIAQGEGGWTEEFWTAPAAGLLLGLSRSVAGEGRVAFEYMRVEAGREGVVFHAAPGGGFETAFPAVEVSRERLRVERPDHDFPRAIEYRPVRGDSMVARVFRGVDDPEPAFTLRFGRTGCPGVRP